MHRDGRFGSVGGPEEARDEGGGLETTADEEEEGDDVSDLVVELWEGVWE